MITLFTHTAGPNGWKVAIVLEELGLQYESKYLSFDKGEQKAPEFTKYNPNGRIPAIIDHDNDDFVLWESGAIIQYLVERYDKDNKIHYPSPTKEYYETAQWIAFQISGQGPYFGQAAWFTYYHAEKIPSAVERYHKEIDRVTSVLDKVLSSKPYLVGSKVTIADLIFVPWNDGTTLLLGKDSSVDLTKYEHYQRWHSEMMKRPAVAKVFEEKAKVIASPPAS